MARYIDADKLIAEYDRVHVGPAGGARKLMVEAPTADVVPRAEAENYKSIAEHQQKLSMGRYFEIKQLKQELDKAKGEVERLEGELIVESTRRKNAVDAYHEARQKVAREIFMDIDRVVEKYSMGDIEYPAFVDYIAELKKKYTEGEK